MNWNKDLETIGVSATTSLVTTLITLWLSRKARRSDEASVRRAERLNRDKNVVRFNETRQTAFGVMDKSHWFVNPFWISQVGEVLQIREYPNYRLLDTKEIVEDRLVLGQVEVPLSWERVLKARESREWIVLRDNWQNGLVYYTREPCTFEDGHLFQELPPDKKWFGLIPRKNGSRSSAPNR